MTTSRAVLAAGCALMLGLLCAGQAQAFVYWNQELGSEISRASLNGSGVASNFVDGAARAADVTVDADHIYWVNAQTGAIGRANLDGTGVEQNFITGLGEPREPNFVNFLTDVAVDADHIYWVKQGDGVSTSGTIGRANLDGTGVQPDFITDVEAKSLTVDATHVYWGTGNATIGRANIDGTGVEPVFVDATASGFGGVEGVAVDAGHVYWTNANTDKVGRANLDGTGVDAAFITPVGGFGRSPLLRGVAVDAGHIYWSDANLGWIGRANLDGTGVNSAFVPNAGQPGGLAVDAALLRATSASVSCAPASGAAMQNDGVRADTVVLLVEA